MSLWTTSEIATAVNGKAVGDFDVGGVSIDSRTIRGGDLFVALKGENFDGHDYVAKAINAGAAGALVSHAVTGVDSTRLIIVDDVFAALENLGRAARQRSGAKIIGVTGSVGKTSTRAMLAAMFAEFGITHATSGNLNNHFGMPLTLARMPRDTEFAVIEMGMNHAGEIHALTMQARPDVAIITNVEAVHLEFFGTIEKIAAAKAEIFDGMKAGAFAVINDDNDYAAILREAALAKKLNIIGFGGNSDLKLLSHKVVDDGSEVVASYKGNEIIFRLPHEGRHMALNAVGALAVAVTLGLDVRKAAAALINWQPEEGRGNVVDVTMADGRTIKLIDDSYNASPASIKAALAMLAGKKTLGRKIVALGDMRELGNEAASLHISLLDAAVSSGAGKVFTAGTMMRHLHDALPDSIRGNNVAKAEELLPILNSYLIDGDMLLIKGSHGSNMWKLASMLHKNEA